MLKGLLSPENRERTREQIRKLNASPENRERAGEQMQKLRASSEFREKIRNGLRNSLKVKENMKKARAARTAKLAAQDTFDLDHLPLS